MEMPWFNRSGSNKYIGHLAFQHVVNVQSKSI